MPVRRTHPQPCVQNKTNTQASVTTGTPKHSGIPCAMVLRLIRDLPGVPGLLAPVAREFVHELDPSVGGSGPHDFAVRKPHHSPGGAAHVHRIPRPTCRDDSAYAPLVARDARA
jgi:hypothetical protein